MPLDIPSNQKGRQKVRGDTELKIVVPELIPSDVVDTPLHSLLDLYKICQKMERICNDNEGIGLSAVQIGIPWKLFVVKLPKGNYEYLVNCEYEPFISSDQKMEKKESIEGCLSLRNAQGELRRFVVPRYNQIVVKGKQLLYENDLSIADIDRQMSGLYSIVYQHEIDHQRGILVSEIGKEIVLWN